MLCDYINGVGEPYNDNFGSNSQQTSWCSWISGLGEFGKIQVL